MILTGAFGRRPERHERQLAARHRDQEFVQDANRTESPSVTLSLAFPSIRAAPSSAIFIISHTLIAALTDGDDWGRTGLTSSSSSSSLSEEDDEDENPSGRGFSPKQGGLVL